MTVTSPETTSPSIPHAIAAKAVHVTKTYGKGEAQVTALNDVSADFYSGEFTAIMGPSGSGKSTLLHCVAGLDRVNGGEVWIGETDITRMREKKLTLLRRNRIGFIFQSFNLLPTFTAQENIELPVRLARKKVEKSWLNKVVETVGLSDRLKHKPSELSGGQQQRVAVARALASKPEIVFADEPTGNLDSKSGAEVLKFMRSAVDEYNQTIVMVTHDPNAAAYADRVVFLADGKIVNEMREPTSTKILDYLKEIG
jgi:putative ABC transport system ATP-binding protein